MFNFNKFAEKQDYEFAEECWNAIENLANNDDNFGGERFFHLEGIFLDLTDRTEAHPKVPFGLDDRGGYFEKFVKSLGLGNKKIIWKYTEVFNFNKYKNDNWFPAALDMFAIELEEMQIAKDLYLSRRINFFEYFCKRLDTYNKIQASNFVKLYKGIDLEKYKNKLRDILKELPVMTKEGEFE